MMQENNNIAVLIPCHNEEKSIAQVIRDFKSFLPKADIYVFDNCSVDKTAEIAKENGAIVRFENNKGKGNVVKRMFSDIDADIYVLVDGDNTYDPKSVTEMINLMIKDNLDMVVGKRVGGNFNNEYRFGHSFGNKLLTGFVGLIFGNGFSDILSGYRVMTKRFVKSFPALSSGFEIETEITIHALQLEVASKEINTKYSSRESGSYSKLNTFKDGLKILWLIFIMFKDEKPFSFFGILSILFFSISLLFFYPILDTYISTGMVPRLPTAILSSVLMILSFVAMIAGVILDSMSRLKLQIKKLNYLSK